MRRAGKADSADKECARHMPDFIARARGGMAEDDLHDERGSHRDGDGAAQKRGRKA